MFLYVMSGLPACLQVKDDEAQELIGDAVKKLVR
jgi:hypothetical protein